MTKLVTAAFFTLLVACGSSHPNAKQVDKTGSGSGECAPTDCGAEPPISPSVCPEGAAISSSCTRAASGSCERKILCDGKDSTEGASGAPAGSAP